MQSLFFSEGLENFPDKVKINTIHRIVVIKPSQFKNSSNYTLGHFVRYVKGFFVVCLSMGHVQTTLTSKVEGPGFAKYK